VIAVNNEGVLFFMNITYLRWRGETEGGACSNQIFIHKESEEGVYAIKKTLTNEVVHFT